MKLDLSKLHVKKVVVLKWGEFDKKKFVALIKQFTMFRIKTCQSNLRDVETLQVDKTKPVFNFYSNFYINPLLDNVNHFFVSKHSSCLSQTGQRIAIYNKTFIDFNFGRYKDLSTLKSDIHLGLRPWWISLFLVDKSLYLPH